MLSLVHVVVPPDNDGMAHSLDVHRPGCVGYPAAHRPTRPGAAGEVPIEDTAATSPERERSDGIRALLTRLARFARAVIAPTPTEAAGLRATFEDGVRPPMP